MKEHDHTAKFYTDPSDEVREHGFGKQPPVHEKYSDELDEDETFGIRWVVTMNALVGFREAEAHLVVMERTISQDPITTIRYEDVENVPIVACEKTADYFIEMAEQI